MKLFIVPWLAASHTVSDDGLTWEFKLKPGIKFHDGSPFTADDVVFSINRANGPGSNVNSNFSTVKSVNKINDYRIEKSQRRIFGPRPVQEHEPEFLFNKRDPHQASHLATTNNGHTNVVK